MSVQEITSVLPGELLYSTPQKLEESKTVSYSVNSLASEYSQAGTDIRFTMPMVQKQFLKSNSLSISGTMVFTLSGAGVNSKFALQGTLYSIFQNQQIQLANGQIIENFNNPGILVNSMLNQTADISQQNPLSLSYGVNSGISSNCTLLLNGGSITEGWMKDGAVVNVDFCIPLISALSNSSSVPMFMSDMTLIMTLGNIASLLVKTTTGTTDGTCPFTKIQNLRLNYDCMELSNNAFSSWLSYYPSQKFLLKNISYTYTNYVIPANQTGTIDMPLNFNLASAKQLFISFKTTDNNDGDFGSLNPNLDSIQFITGTGELYPTRPIDCKNGALVFYYQQKGWNSYYSKDTNGLVNRTTFLKRYVEGNGYAKYNSTAANILDNANKFFICIDLEKLSANSDLTYNGAKISLNSYVRIQIAAACDKAITAHMFVSYDQFWAFDMANNIISVIS